MAPMNTAENFRLTPPYSFLWGCELDGRRDRLKPDRMEPTPRPHISPTGDRSTGQAKWGQTMKFRNALALCLGLGVAPWALGQQPDDPPEEIDPPVEGPVRGDVARQVRDAVQPIQTPDRIDPTTPVPDIDPTLLPEGLQLPAISAQDIEHYDSSQRGEVDMRRIVFPGGSRETEVYYEVIDGLAIVEGDIILGPADDLDAWDAPQEQPAQRRREGDTVTAAQPLNTVSNLEMLWPNGLIPYELHPSVPDNLRARVDTAAQRLTNQTNLILRRRNSTDENFVRVRSGNGCSSRIGMTGGSQPLRVSGGCSFGNIMHEFLHAAGVFHEQSRTDRNEFVEVFRSRVKVFRRHNFQIERDSAGLGPYDYGSIMHYGPTAFAFDDCSGNGCITIRPVDGLPGGVTMGQRNGLSAQDIEAINLLYPGFSGPEFGLEWGDRYYATAAAFGDVDGDGRDELAIGRNADENARFFVLGSPADSSTDTLFSGGENWGSSYYVTDIAFGDIDGDGRDELAVARRASENSRFFVFDDADAGFSLIHDGGENWGSGAYATAVAFGDVDGDGRDELAVGRQAGQNDRYFLFDDAGAASPFAKLAGGGSNWGSGNYTTALALGDVDGDGDDELGVARRAGQNARYFVDDYRGGGLVNVKTGGENWGGDYYATAIAFGDVDGDPAEEVLVGRRANENARFFLLDDQDSNFAPLRRGGANWGSGYYTVGVDIGDFDGDGVGEIAVARNAGENSRFFINDDASNGFDPIPLNGRIWQQGVGSTGIAFGDAEGDGDADVAVTRRQDIRGRTRYEVLISN
ncbi:MAG: M12 family metallopeptidase [Oceanicaulis sp.]